MSAPAGGHRAVARRNLLAQVKRFKTGAGNRKLYQDCVAFLPRLSCKPKKGRSEERPEGGFGETLVGIDAQK
jgi:hypothetical protein